jgi:hypothetical protein
MSTTSFVIPVKNRVEKLNKILSSIRTHYPQERIIIYSNGTQPENVPLIEDISVKYATETHFTEPIYSYDTPAKLFRDIFDIFNENPTDFLVRIDTDAHVHRKINDLDSYAYGVIGCVLDTQSQHNKVFQDAAHSGNFELTIPLPYVNAVIIFPKNIIQKFLTLQTFDAKNDDYYKQKYLKARLNAFFDSADKIPLSMDHILMMGCQDANVQLLDHPEIYSVTKAKNNNFYIGAKPLDSNACSNEINNGEKYAFVHPVDS